MPPITHSVEGLARKPVLVVVQHAISGEAVHKIKLAAGIPLTCTVMGVLEMMGCTEISLVETLSLNRPLSITK